MIVYKHEFAAAIADTLNENMADNTDAKPNLGSGLIGWQIYDAAINVGGLETASGDVAY